MQQIIQSYRTGEVGLFEVPAPRCPRNGILVRNRASLVSIGTERSMIELGRKSLIGKARSRPDLAKRALDKARRDGFWKTFREALARLDMPTPLGYSSAGTVIEVGENAHGFSPGERVACIGHGFASHADIVAVPSNMASRIPAGLTEDEAAFAMLGAIAMHGVRESRLGLGGTVAVLGLGLLGLLAVQLLRAYGCVVVAMDPDSGKTALAKDFGALAVANSPAEMLEVAAICTQGLGCDAIVVTAATTSAEPLDLAVSLSRQKGRIVVVGMADIHPDRNEMWRKEVEIVVSRAGGAGALDPLYELDGIDLPISYARWTQGRNVDEFLRLAAEGRLNLKRLITHHVPIAEAEATYTAMIDGTLQGAIGIVLQYPHTVNLARSTILNSGPVVRRDALRVGVVGAGQFGRSVLIPALARSKDIALALLATASGATATHAGNRFGFAECTTDADAVFAREDIHAVFALTPHSRHARDILSALRSGKHIFVEKPLCVNEEELDEIEGVISGSANSSVVMVGHNRRYSPHTEKVRGWLAKRASPLVITVRVNAGFIPREHWVHSDAEGRSRIVGEMTHFLDLIEAASSSEIREISAVRVAADDRMVVNNDNLIANIRLADGSIAAIVYSSQGSRSYPREQIEIFSGGAVIVSTDFRKSVLHDKTREEKFSTAAQDYGYASEIRHFIAAAKGEIEVEPRLTSTFRIMRAAFALERSLAIGRPVVLS